MNARYGGGQNIHIVFGDLGSATQPRSNTKNDRQAELR